MDQSGHAAGAARAEAGRPRKRLGAAQVSEPIVHHELLNVTIETPDAPAPVSGRAPPREQHQLTPAVEIQVLHDQERTARWWCFSGTGEDRLHRTAGQRDAQGIDHGRAVAAGMHDECHDEVRAGFVRATVAIAVRRS